ncbi:hypothetical protein ACNQ17_02950 [Mycoplasma sp. Sp48II]|uniref:hypothetical protein n=1 Tax=unclassified Mycoplasma TaxID=2683645 RepID=UPI003A8878D2
MSYSLFCKRAIKQRLAAPYRLKNNRKAITNLIEMRNNISKVEILLSIKMKISVIDKVLSN